MFKLYYFMVLDFIIRMHNVSNQARPQDNSLNYRECPIIAGVRGCENNWMRRKSDLKCMFEHAHNNIKPSGGGLEIAADNPSHR